MAETERTEVHADFGTYCGDTAGGNGLPFGEPPQVADYDGLPFGEPPVPGELGLRPETYRAGRFRVNLARDEDGDLWADLCGDPEPDDLTPGGFENLSSNDVRNLHAILGATLERLGELSAD
jgi:hypothetical protein